MYELPLFIGKFRKVLFEKNNGLTIEDGPEFPKFGPYRKRNKFIKVVNDRL